MKEGVLAHLCVCLSRCKVLLLSTFFLFLFLVFLFFFYLCYVVVFSVAFQLTDEPEIMGAH